MLIVSGKYTIILYILSDGIPFWNIMVFIAYKCKKGGWHRFKTGAVRMACVIHNSMNALHMTVYNWNMWKEYWRYITVSTEHLSICTYTAQQLQHSTSYAGTRWSVCITPVLRISNNIYNILSKFKHRLYQVIQLRVGHIHSEGK